MIQKHPHNYGLSGQKQESQYDPFVGGMITGVINAFDKKHRKQSNEMKLREREAALVDSTANTNFMNALADSLAQGDNQGSGGVAGSAFQNIALVLGGGLFLVMAIRWIRNKQRTGTSTAVAS